MGLQEQTWVLDILRQIIAWLDVIVYSLVKVILQGIFDLSSLTTSSDILSNVYKKVYVVVGVFMTFKLTISFFQYIVNPDLMMDKKERGLYKLFERAIIMIVALIGLPGILFGSNGKEGILSRTEKVFLPLVPKIILGTNGDNLSDQIDIETAAETTAVATLRAFFYPDKEKLAEVCTWGTGQDPKNITTIGELSARVNDACQTSVIPKVDFLFFHIGSKVYVYTYVGVISTIVGVLLIKMLLGISVDVAKRIFKMIVLEMIAPIPIMSLIDPKGATEKGAFGSWVKTLINTFLDIFIRIGIVYFVLVLIQLIVSKGLFTNFPEFADAPIRAVYLTVMLIIGLIYFAKEAPGFIRKSIGLSEKFDEGMLGSMFNNAAARAGGVAGAASGLASGAVGGLLNGGFKGMVGGALEGAAAGREQGLAGKPAATAGYNKGADKGAQIRTGSDKAKGGLLHNLEHANNFRRGEEVKFEDENGAIKGHIFSGAQLKGMRTTYSDASSKAASVVSRNTADDKIIDDGFKYGDNVSVNAALHRMTEDRGNYMGSTVDYTTGELTGGYKGYSVEEVKDTSGNIIDSKIFKLDSDGHKQRDAAGNELSWNAHEFKLSKEYQELQSQAKTRQSYAQSRSEKVNEAYKKRNDNWGSK